jgi:hypothetical protein
MRAHDPKHMVMMNPRIGIALAITNIHAESLVLLHAPLHLPRMSGSGFRFDLQSLPSQYA